MTRYQLQKEQEKDEVKREEELKLRKAVERKDVGEEAYLALVDQKNVNREVGVIEARTVDEAISAVAHENEETDQHPER